MNIKIPKNINPHDFFNNFFLSEFNKIKDNLDILNLEFVIGIEISGKGGGDWSIIYNNGEIDISNNMPDEAFFTLALNIEDWDVALKVGLGEFLFSVIDFDMDFSKKLISQEKINKISKENGKININLNNIFINSEYLDMKFSIVLGEPLPSDPKVNIFLNQDSFNKIIKDYKNIYQLISKKDIDISDDFSFLMKIITISFLGF